MRGYRLPFARYLFLRVDDVERAAAWIAETTAEVLTAAPWDNKPDSGVNIAFSYSGLRALQLPDASLAGSRRSSVRGWRPAQICSATTATAIRPTGRAASAGPDIHALVMISAKHEEALDAHDARVRAGLEANGGLTVVYEDVGAALPGGVEHFGYADGFAQPSIEGSTIAPTPGQGAPSGNGDWRPIRAGEFILGYPDEEGVLPTAPPPVELSINGSYMVYRKLRQDVAAFRQRLAESAACIRAARSCSPPRSSAGGGTAPRSRCRPRPPDPGARRRRAAQQRV